MAEPSTISVIWPPLDLGEAGFKRRLEDLADRAEALVGKRCTLQQTAELAVELFGLVWPAFGPETVAATARASALLNLPVVLSTAPAGQVQEISARLDDIWRAAQDDPSVCVVEVGPLLLNQVKEPQTRKRRSRSQPEDALELDPDADLAGVIELEPAPASPVADPDDLPAAWMDCAEPQHHPVDALEVIELEPLPVVITPLPPSPAPARPLRPLAERTAPRPAPAPAEPVPEPEPMPAPAPRRRTAPAPAPPGWFSAADVAELLDASAGSVGRWRKDGRLGDEGIGWQQCGRCFYFAPDAVENIDRARIPGGLDQLVAEVQAA